MCQFIHFLMRHFLKNHQDFVYIVVSGRAVPFIFIVFLASFAYLFFCINIIISFLHHRKRNLVGIIMMTFNKLNNQLSSSQKKKSLWHYYDDIKIMLILKEFIIFLFRNMVCSFTCSRLLSKCLERSSLCWFCTFIVQLISRFFIFFVAFGIVNVVFSFVMFSIVCILRIL